MYTGRLVANRGKLTSSLLGVTWRVPGIGEVQVIAASAARCCAVDLDWSNRRPPDASNLGWSWGDVHTWAAECFALVLLPERTTVGLFASKKPVVRFGNQTYYRLDYIEIDPSYRGGGLGAFALAFAFKTAIERARDGVLLGSLPETTAIYEGYGLSTEIPVPWVIDAGLVRFFGPPDVLLALSKEVDPYVVTAQ